jgi:peptide/nickel transport system permease protein
MRIEKNKRNKEHPALIIWRRFRKNKLAMVGMAMVIFVALLAAFADVLAPPRHDFPGVPGYYLQDWVNARLFPSREHIFGTDSLGRGIFERIVHGARISMLVGAVVVSLGLGVGVPLGTVAGYYGGTPDNLIMRITDIILAKPTILLAIVIAAVLGPGMLNVMVAVGIASIPTYARTVRAMVMTVKEKDFVEAARSAGASDWRLIRKNILPNCTAPLIVEATMGYGSAILSAAALSFIGIGLQAPRPEWGAMLAEGRGQMLAGYWHTTLFPGLFIAIMIISLNMMGDGLRDAFDPRLRGAQSTEKKANK